MKLRPVFILCGLVAALAACSGGGAMNGAGGGGSALPKTVKRPDASSTVVPL
jgi:hypothetical protein